MLHHLHVMDVTIFVPVSYSNHIILIVADLFFNFPFVTTKRFINDMSM